MDEQGIESLDLVQSEDRKTIGNFRSPHFNWGGVEELSTPTPVHKLTEKTNENSNNKVSHGIQAIENENSNLAQVIELVSMISNIIKRSPELLQLLPKLKNSEDDKAKALLLFEAMLDKF
ncbi:hypothetical protein TNCV_811081 [Trichonephila clavipes]|uniref:Uncharacterized protein n=1 Tax=Trichonephila clavipes TaxID=2585209 RepID=A0A8X6VJW1_TRICX|nr:hypothetical protein TNCV_811081 [Trichonephila clavipes]